MITRLPHKDRDINYQGGSGPLFYFLDIFNIQGKGVNNEANEKGFVKVQDDMWLCTAKNLEIKQGKWGDQYECLEIDFSESEFWITSSDDYPYPIDISTIYSILT